MRVKSAVSGMRSRVVSQIFATRAERGRWTPLSAAKVAAQLIGSADDIDASNPNHVGLLGSGRVNALRALRQVARDPFGVIPALIVPVFFYVVNIGALEKVAENG